MHLEVPRHQLLSQERIAEISRQELDVRTMRRDGRQMRGRRDADSALAGEPILIYAKRSEGAEAYRQLAREVLKDD